MPTYVPVYLASVAFSMVHAFVTLTFRTSSRTTNQHLSITMRASSILSRGSKGYSWYNHFLKHGNEGFKRYASPTPFDWSKNSGARSKVFFDISIGTEDLGRLVFELADDVVPKTVENFKLLATGDNIHNRSLLQSKFHQVQKGQFIMGGDVENNDGTGSHSAYAERYIKDENFIIPHTERGFLSMASVGLDTGGSQFYISLSPNTHMNGRCVVFGRMDPAGEPILAAIEKVFTFRGVPSTDVVIKASGVL